MQLTAYNLFHPNLKCFFMKISVFPCTLKSKLNRTKKIVSNTKKNNSNFPQVTSSTTKKANRKRGKIFSICIGKILIFYFQCQRERDRGVWSKVLKPTHFLGET